MYLIIDFTTKDIYCEQGIKSYKIQRGRCLSEYQRTPCTGRPRIAFGKPGTAPPSSEHMEEKQELLPPRPSTWVLCRSSFLFRVFFSTFYVLCRILSVSLLYRNLIFFRVSLTLIVNLLNDHNLKFLCSLTLYMYL